VNPKHLQEAIGQFFFSENPISVRVFGSSMLPVVNDGSRVDVIPCPQSLRSGQCYVFLFNGSLLLHRLVFATRRTAFFIGDNTGRLERVVRQDIIGEAMFEYPAFRLLMVNIANLVYCIFKKFRRPPRNAMLLRNRWISFWLKGTMSYEGTVHKA
jgi:hypothetical protein